LQKNSQLAQKITEYSFDQYARGNIQVQDLLRAIENEAATRANLLNTYLDYRKSLFNLIKHTFFDYEHGVPLSERFDIFP